MSVPRGTWWPELLGRLLALGALALFAGLIIITAVTAAHCQEDLPPIHLEDDEEVDELPPAKVPPIHLPDDEREESDDDEDPIVGSGPHPAFKPQPLEQPVRFRAWVGRYHGFTGESSDNGWFGALAVEGPVAGVPKLGLRVELAFAGEPGKTLSLTDAETWGRDAELRLGPTWPLARLEAGGQVVTTEGVASWTVKTALGSEKTLRYARSYALGVRFAERVSGAFLEVAWGRDEEAGPFGRGQLMLRGLFPLVRVKGVAAAAIVGDVVVNVVRPSGEGRDRFRLGAVIAR